MERKIENNIIIMRIIPNIITALYFCQKGFAVCRNFGGFENA
jgi:hypothetical protein